MVNLTTLAFWKKRESSLNDSERIIPLPPFPAQILSSPTFGSEEDVHKAKEALRVLQLERQIIGSALTTIFESESKGMITSADRVRLVGKYRMDLQQLEEEIKHHQRVVNLNDLENSRQELVKSFNLRMAEIDGKIRSIEDGDIPEQLETQAMPPVDPPPRPDLVINDAERRVEQIRDEILKAMDRLEQIESDV